MIGCNGDDKNRKNIKGGNNSLKQVIKDDKTI